MHVTAGVYGSNFPPNEKFGMILYPPIRIINLEIRLLGYMLSPQGVVVAKKYFPVIYLTWYHDLDCS